MSSPLHGLPAKAGNLAMAVSQMSTGADPNAKQAIQPNLVLFKLLEYERRATYRLQRLNWPIWPARGGHYSAITNQGSRIVCSVVFCSHQSLEIPRTYWLMLRHNLCVFVNGNGPEIVR